MVFPFQTPLRSLTPTILNSSLFSFVLSRKKFHNSKQIISKSENRNNMKPKKHPDTHTNRKHTQNTKPKIIT